ncbi:hypothetical protein DM02DRAFT_530574 [Periconia macrospinosa]|uniref:Uncharacterized protein n=1 Tax=Periconia macrospinosa TaxID=97972 RepID=A0A2V1DKX6_9PLEO|nr:hypothetical protein DM02DRAFT_530574 [Periconia macrospinosa]
MSTEQLDINSLVEAVNKNDRLNLLNDPSVLAGNLDNPIHPIFRGPSFSNPHLQQALRFASLLIQEDRLLDFFIPLTYGRAQTDLMSGKTYLTNPATWKSNAEISLYIRGVRKALDCLTHCVIFKFTDPEDRLWGRATMLPNKKPAHSPSCSKAFQKDLAVLVELNGKLFRFYEDEETGYITRSVCDQFRHDFQFAATLVHELVHAFGIMRRAGLKEPYIRLDMPDTEWGYAWENFAFGMIVNPQDRQRFGTHVQLRKIWSNSVHEKMGKEYAAVPVAWTAQWFRKETWGRIAVAGLLAIPLPVTRVKFIKSARFRRWVVMTDVPETQHDIEMLHGCAVKERLQSPSLPTRDMELCRVMWSLLDSAELQVPNVPITSRIPTNIDSYSYQANKKKASVSEPPRYMFRKVSVVQWSCTALPPVQLPLADSTSQSVDCRLKRSREDEDDDDNQSRKRIKY